MKTWLVIFLAATCFCSFAQQSDSVISSVDSITGKVPQARAEKQSNIILHFNDDHRLKGRLQQLDRTYIVFRANQDEHAANLNKYYLRAHPDGWKVDMGYVQKVTIKRGRAVALTALAGALALGVTGGALGYNVAESEDASFGNYIGSTLIGASLGIVVGGAGGALFGIVRRRQITVQNNPSAFDELTQFYMK